MDVRYQAISEPIAVKSLGNHLERPWDDVHVDWDEDDPLRYYWHGASPTVTDWNDALIQPSRRIC